MKKLFVISLALATLFSCSKEIAINEESNNGDVKYMSFTAIIEDPNMDEATKATLGKDGVFAWAENDEVKFYKNDGSSEIGKVQSDLTTINVADGEYVSAVYPAAAGDGKYSVDFSNRGPIVVAKVASGSLKFYHIGSMMTINVAGIPTSCKLEVMPNGFSGSYNNGDYTFTGEVPALSASTPSLSLVDVTTDDADQNVTVAVANYNYSAGFTLGLKKDGRYLYKKSTAKAFDISTRATLLNMKAVTYVAPTMIYITTKSSTKTYDLTKAPLIYNGSNYASQINCDANTDIYLTDDYNEEFKYGHVNAGNYYSIYADATSQGVSYISSTLDGPWGWGESNFSNDMYVMGPLVGDNAWNSGTSMTYKNHIWTLSGIRITSTETQYEFKFKRYSDWWQNNSGTLNASTMYGSAYKYGTEGDQLKKTFSQTGIYTLYANAVSGDSAPIRFMFVRTGNLD